MTDPYLATRKAALRRDARARRKALQAEHPEADWMAAERAGEMLAALGLADGGIVAVYRALGAEIDPRPLGDLLAGRGWRLALPCVEAPDAPLVFRGWTPGERLSPDLSGLAAPPSSSPTVRPDLIMVPLLAFDPGGGRLGHGGGHYDRTLAALRAEATAPPAVGLAYAGQEIADLPRERHDQPLDGILTEAGYIAARKDF